MTGGHPRSGVHKFFRLDVRREDRAIAESDDELDAFLEARIEDFVSLGMTPSEARAEAIHRLGGASLDDARGRLRRSAATRDEHLHWREWLDDLRADLRVAVRALWRERGYAIIVALTLSLGIGSASATFAAIRHVLLEPLPVRDQGALAVLTVENTASLNPHVGITYALLSDLQARSHAIESAAGVPAALAAAPYAARDGDRVVQLALTGTTANFFQVLGSAPRLGRLLEASDESGSQGAAAVLSYSAWRTIFGGRADIVGHQISFNVGAFTIVGVAPQELDYPLGTDVWVSDAEFLRLAGYAPKPDDGYWDTLVRLKAHIGIDDARKELVSTIAESTAPLLGPAGTRHVAAQSFTDVVVGNQRTALILFAVAVSLVLIVACINVAGLLLARGLAREREIAVRKAIGATTRRIMRQLMVENLVLSLVGGALGILCAKLLLHALIALAPSDLARMDQVRLDPLAVAFAVALTLLTAVAFGLAPALSTARARLDAPLRSETRSQSVSVRAVRARQWLVVSQIALGVVMLTSSGLLVRSLARQQHLELGFDPHRLLFLFVSQLDANGADFHASQVRHSTVIRGLVERLKSMPDVVNASSVDALPFSVVAGTGGFEVHYGLEGQPYSALESSPTAGFNLGSADLFATLRIPLVHGRGFTPDDKTGNRQVTIVSESFAERAWPGKNPLGQQLRFFNDGAVGLWRTVIGVVANTKYHDFLTERPEVYIPIDQSEPGTFIVARTIGDPLLVAPLARRALGSLDGGYGVARAVSAEQLLGSRLARPKFLAATVVVLAATVSLLAAVGLFGVLAFTINQRRRELGIRLALGAAAHHLRSLVFREVIRLTAIGLVLGLAIGLPAARLLRHEIVGISIFDPLSLIAVLAVLITTVALASALPVARAARVDPVTAIRE